MMKNAILLAAAAVLFTMTSCKKDYECACSGTYSFEHKEQSYNQGVWPIYDQRTVFESTKEDDAESDCQDYKTQIEGDIESGNMSKYDSDWDDDDYYDTDDYNFDSDISCSTREID